MEEKGECDSFEDKQGKAGGEARGLVQTGRGGLFISFILSISPYSGPTMC